MDALGGHIIEKRMASVPPFYKTYSKTDLICSDYKNPYQITFCSYILPEMLGS